MNSKLPTLIFASLLGISLLSSQVHALPVDLSIPAGGLGPTRADGAAQHWLELGEFDFGQGLALPLRLWFDSDRVKGPDDFGKGSLWWRSPVFHASVLSRAPAQHAIMLPCGKVMQLYKQEAGGFATADGEWTAAYRGKQFIVSRADGWELEYDTVGWLVRLRTDTARNLLWNRDPKGKLISISEQAKPTRIGQKMVTPRSITGFTVRRDAPTGRVTALESRTPFGLKVYRLAYDDQQRLTSVSLPDQTTETYSYGTDKDSHPLIRIIRRDLVEQSLTWDKTTRKLRSDGVWTYNIEGEYTTTSPRMTRTGPNGETESHLDDSTNSGRTEFTAADGTTTIRQNLLSGPAKGKLESVTRLLIGAKEPQVMHRASYDDKGNLAEETDALGRKTKHAYTLWGATQQSGIQTHTRTDAAGATTREDYDRKGNLTSVTNALGHTTTYFYDVQNRRIRTQGPDGNTSETLTYTPQGRLASRTEAAGAKTTFGYDKDGNRTTTTNALGHVTRDEFDARGNRIKSTNALGHTWTYEYDKASRLVKTFAPETQDAGSMMQGAGSKEQGAKNTAQSASARPAPSFVPPAPSALPPASETRTYTAQGKLATITDASGNTTRTEYDALSRIIARTDALDRITRYSYEVKKGATGCTACNASSMPTLITLPSGRKIQRVYDADKHLIEETTAVGTAQAATTKHEYDLAGNLTQTTDALGRMTRYEYDAVNRRTAMTYPDNSQRRYAYDAAGQLVAETNELGHASKRSYDAFGNLLTSTDAAGNVTTQLFDAPGAAALRRPTGTQSPAGVTVRHEHDALGRRITQLIGSASSPAPAIKDQASAIQNPASAIQSPVSSITRHIFDAVGNELETLDPVGKLTRHTFDARNRRTSTTDALGREWHYSYADSAGASGNPPCCGADPTANNRAQTVTHPDGTQETRLTDAAGQLIETRDAKGDRIRYEYDPDGRLIALIDARGSVTRWTYDPRGKLESKVYPDRTLELYEHDAAGQLLTRTRPDGTAAVNTYDARGRLLSTRWKDNKAEPTDYTYDAAGHLLTAKNQSATIERSYTPTGKIASETQIVTASLGQGAESQEQGASPPNPASAIQSPASGIQNPAPSYQVGYDYTPDGRLAALTYPDGTQIAYHYGPRGELTQVTEASRKSGANTPVERGADTPVGQGARDTSVASPSPTTGDKSVASTLDGKSAVATPAVLATYTRRADNKITELKLANGLTTKKTYDAAGRLAEVLHVAPNGTLLSSEASRYDQRDRRTARIKGDGTTDLFAYDPAGQVIAAAYAQAFDASQPLPVLAQGAAGTEQGASNNPNPGSSIQPQASRIQAEQTFAYDPAGNRKQFQDLDGTQTHYQTNEANQYQQLSVSSVNSVVEPKYDKNGNLLVDTQNTYTWDADIHLLAVTTRSGVLPAAVSDPATTTQFRYDPLHRRVARLEPDGTLTHFVHDGWNVIAEHQSSPALQRAAPSLAAQATSPPSAKSATKPSVNELKLATTFIWSEDLSGTMQGAGGIAGLLVTRESAATPPKATPTLSLVPSPLSLFFSYDSNGNVILLTDAEATPTARYSYDAFGKTLTATGPAAETNCYRFSTKPVEIGSGLCFYGFRYYSPELGRWTSKDPYGERGGYNLFAFISNRIGNKVDKLGREEVPNSTGTEQPGGVDNGQNCLGYAVDMQSVQPPAPLSWNGVPMNPYASDPRYDPVGYTQNTLGGTSTDCEGTDPCPCGQHRIIIFESSTQPLNWHAYRDDYDSYSCQYGNSPEYTNIEDPLLDYLAVYQPTGEVNRTCLCVPTK